VSLRHDVNERRTIMASHPFMNERVDVALRGTFEQAEATFEKNVPQADIAEFTRLAQARASASEIEGAVKHMQGDLEFMTFAKIPQGSLTSLLGTPKKLSVYLVGNPVLAHRMFERHRGAGLYAPLRVSLYEDQIGVVHFTYDRPSSLLGSFGDAEIKVVAQVLDDKLAILATRLMQ
jgi:hypothetical protein